MSDQCLYELSTMNESKEEIFTKKEVVYVIDSNQGSYSGNQIFLDTSTLANSGKYISFSEAYLTVPVTIQMKGSADITASAGPYDIAWKSGFWHLFDSFQVDYNGTNIIALTSFSNIYTHFKVLTTWSQDEVNKYGASLGFWKDTANSFGYANAASTSGRGFYNNTVVGTAPIGSLAAATAYLGATYNAGCLSRLQAYGYTSAYLGAGLTSANASQVAFPYFAPDAGAAAARNYYWSVIAKIRLKDIHDFFGKVPLVKGAFLRFTINVNVCNFTITTTNTPNMTIAAGGMTLSRNTCPVIFCSGAANNPNATNINGNGTITVAVAIGANAGVSQAFTGVRLYVPLYTFAPSYEEQYLKMNPTIRVDYEDLYSYLITAIPSGNNFNNLLTNGIINPKRVVIVPIYNVASNGGLAYNELQSPFSTVPGTTSPLAVIQNLQVQVAGVNMLQNNVQYDFDIFTNEVAKTGLNGGITSEMGSGLINEQEWEFAYRYYTVDLSRRLSIDDAVPKSILISGTNLSSLTLDLYTYCSFGRTITISTADGSLIM